MAMRSMWKGNITFGMVVIPTKLYKGYDDEDESVKTNLIHVECRTRIKQDRTCPKCQKVLSAAEMVKGFPVDEKAGIYLPITPEDLAGLPVPSSHTIQVDGFLEDDPVADDPRWLAETYIMAPEDVGKRAFALFLRAMRDMNVLGIGKIAISQKEHVCLLRPDDAGGALLVQTLRWADQLRAYGAEMPALGEVSEQELVMGKALVGAMLKDVDLAVYKDDYRDALRELIRAKLAGENIVMPVFEEKKATGADLMETLMASLAAVEAGGK